MYLYLNGVCMDDMSREEVGVAARLISAELYRRNPDLIADGSDGLEEIGAAKGDLRMGDRMLADMDYEALDDAAALLAHRIRELDVNFERVYGSRIDDDWLEARMYVDSTGADAAVSSAKEVAGIASGRIKRKPFCNPFAPGSDCNPFAHLAEQGKGIGK